MNQRDELTAEIEGAESRVNEINEIFCDPKYFDQTPDKEVRKLEAEQKSLSSKIEELMTHWEELEAEIATLE